MKQRRWPLSRIGLGLLINMSGGINSICDHQDLLAEILLRLPVTGLIKFKCVSKQWLSLISDPDFCYSHTRRIQQLQTQKPNSSLLIHSAPTRLSLLHLKDESASMSLPRLDYLQVQSLTMLDYCNGLTLFGGFPLDCASDDHENGYSIFVCNPITRQFRSLFTSTTYSVFVLSFDPCKSPHYKVIVLVIAPKELMIKHLRIYCSASNSWRSVECSDVESPPYLNPAVYFNGTVYWASNGEMSVCFNVDTERFKILPSPLDTSRTYATYLRASCGHLFMVCLAWYLKCKVFEMASDCSGWFVRYHVDLLAPPFSQVWGSYILLDIIVGEKEEDTMIVTIAPPSAISYNIHDGTTKVFCDRLSKFYWEGSRRVPQSSILGLFLMFEQELFFVFYRGCARSSLREITLFQPLASPRLVIAAILFFLNVSCVLVNLAQCLVYVDCHAARSNRPVTKCAMQMCGASKPNDIWLS